MILMHFFFIGGYLKRGTIIKNICQYKQTVIVINQKMQTALQRIKC